MHQGLIGLVHRRLLEGATDRSRLAREVRSQGQRALKVLGEGLAGYGAKTDKVVAKRVSTSGGA
jgi:hypothetical protein